MDWHPYSWLLSSTGNMMTCSRHNQTNFEVPHPVHKVSYLHRSYIFSDLEYLSFEVRWCRPFQEYRYKNLQKIRDAIRKKKLVCLIKLVRPRTLCKKDWILLMFLLYNFMISIYSSISIETELVTHFSGYKIITIPLKRVLHVLNHNFYFFTYRNITKFSKSIPSALVTLIY